MTESAHYRGRFAPSPTGPLHAGSLVAALASWLDARAHHGRWLLRIDDVDTPRCPAGTDQFILMQLQHCGLLPDEPPVWQSQRGALYAQALAQLQARGWAYPCTCTRQSIARAQAAAGTLHQPRAERVYPGTCRPPGRPTHPSAAARSGAPIWRLHTGRVLANLQLDPTTHWHDRRLGAQMQAVEPAVGDFVLQRADGVWAYQLAVVVDDAAQGISHVVRGADLADNTVRQIVLQQALTLPQPHYLHTPLVLGANGHKLSKQTGAQALDLTQPLATLNQAAQHLGLPPMHGSVADALHSWVAAWAAQTQRGITAQA